MTIEDDNPALEHGAGGTGILLCLRMLAEEAAELRLGYTLTALQQAILACEAEHSGVPSAAATVH